MKNCAICLSPSGRITLVIWWLVYMVALDSNTGRRQAPIYKIFLASAYITFANVSSMKESHLANPNLKEWKVDSTI